MTNQKVNEEIANKIIELHYGGPADGSDYTLRDSIKEALDQKDREKAGIQEELELAKKCSVCGGTDVVCGKGWLQEREKLRKQNEELREALEKIAKPALGGKQQQQWAQDALSNHRRNG